MTLRIERAGARIRLSGDFRSEHMDQVKAEIELCESPAVLDLEELDLVDAHAALTILSLWQDLRRRCQRAT